MVSAWLDGICHISCLSRQDSADFGGGGVLQFGFLGRESLAPAPLDRRCRLRRRTFSTRQVGVSASCQLKKRCYRQQLALIQHRGTISQGFD